MIEGPPDAGDPAEPTSANEDVEAVLLCAGVGQRLRPLTDSIPKALVPVAGRPLVDYHLDAWRAAGVRHAVLVTGYREDQIRRRVGDGTRYGLRVEYAVQTDPRGTGHAVLAAADHLSAPWVLVGYCDVFFGRSPSVWTSLLSDREPKIVGASVPDASVYGRLECRGGDRGSYLIAIREKDGVRSPGLINAGAYLLPRRVVEILRHVPSSPRGEIELTDAVTRYVAEGGRVRVVPTPAWVDVGTPERLEEASRLADSSTEARPEPRPSRRTPQP